ncbi:OmpA family protein [Belnapia sp. T6]|uniref:OmpA family protein n=1 Tax=Belnapia mucosa TaxID=2804532 RepID=A0ABS1V3S9_9PROT|nr:OmpA family protein [Belnapia mucosa]MBL6455344.1 OmpA family protein [Belnapia mucosa]
MSLKRALLATTAVALPLLAGLGTASAQPVTGLYIGAGAGANWVNSPERFEPASEGFTIGGQRNTVGKANFNTGWVGVLSLGWGFGNGLRAEIEGNYRENEVDSLRGFNLAPLSRTGGFQRSYGVMANVFYDFDFANFGLGQSVIQPYVGVGAGYALTEFSNIRGVSAGNGLVLHADDKQSIGDGSFAFQGIVGLATPLTWLGVTGLTLTAEYRFFGMLENEVKGSIRDGANRIVGNTRLETDKYNHSAMLGLRYALFQPPPAPPPVVAAPAPAPVPAPARTYLVFFDWDRADLTTRAREIIGEAAQNARRVESTRIEVAGHADRSGTPQYNQRLSERRAQAVAAELMARGIGRNEISVTAFGESRPLVPTADGVREPQNRRVEIVLR